jgi:cyclophilin family peptidyl-prolyl cis-trans isomerase
MWDRIRGGRSLVARDTEGTNEKPLRKATRQPLVEILEQRQLPTASLQPISNLTVPAQQGYTQPLLANTGATAAQSFTVTSSNPDVAVSIAQGPFWSLGVSYTDPNNSSDNFTGTLTFQLFQNLASNTVSQIEAFTNDGYYVNSGKYFPRIVTNFVEGVDVVQGGAATLDGSGSSGQPNTPFANENFQQLAFSGTGQLAMANSGGTDSNDTQFFINTGSPTSSTTLNNTLGYNYTIFGQMVAGTNTLLQMTQIPVMDNTSTGEDSQPVNPLTITSATLSSTNPNGVLLIDTTQAMAGETSTITVTAHDADGTTATESFTVTVGAYGGPDTATSPPSINFRPFASPVTAAAQSGVPTQITLAGTSGYPISSLPSTLSYSLVSQPAHGTVTNFDASTGTFTYTPAKNYIGTDTFQYEVNATGPTLPSGTAPVTPTVSTSNPNTVTVTVGAVNTGAVMMIGPDLVIQPLPKQHGGTNYITVNQIPMATASGGAVLEVYVNGQLDATAPGIATVNQIIVFGGRRTNNYITLTPNVTVPATIDGGHGRENGLKGGSGPTREHGWFGFTTLTGGTGANQLIGLAGHVKFKPTKSTTEIFAGVPMRRTSDLNPTPPGGTFYRFVHGRLVPVPISALGAKTTTEKKDPKSHKQK